MLLKRNICNSLSNMNVRNQNWLNRLILKKHRKDGYKSNKDENKSHICEHKKGINIGIIGGGMTAIHTAMLLKQHRVVESIHVVDPKDKLERQVLDVNQIDTTTRIKHFKKKYLEEALQETSIIALMDDNELCLGAKNDCGQLKKMCSNIRQLAEEIVQFAPTAFLVVFARPVTVTLPMVSEIYKTAGQRNIGRIIGSVAIESMRLEAKTAYFLDLDPSFLSVPLAGGGDPTSLVPLFSHARPIKEFTAEQTKILLQKLQYADNELARMDHEKSTLSIATAAANFLLTVITGLNGTNFVTVNAFVRSSILPACKFFTSELQLGPHGFKENCVLPKISSTEISMIAEAIPLINEYTEMGINAAYDRNVKL